MVLLSIDTSTKSASVSVSKDNKLISLNTLTTSVTHSESTLELINETLKSSNTDISDIEAIAVTVGPGSFTGLRIGIATVKGLALTKNLPCYPVSTLLSLAYSHNDFDGIICPVLDARRNQVYSSIFRAESGVISRLTDDEAISVADLKIKLLTYQDNILLCGDGCFLVYDQLSMDLHNLVLPDDNMRYLQASGVAAAAICSDSVSSENLFPKYLRLSQAERERLEKESVCDN